MAFLIGGANTTSDAAYEVANSCRFNDGDSPKMEKTTSAGSNTIGTFSCWVKRGALGTDQAIFTSTNDTVWFKIWFHNEDYLRIDRFNGSSFLLLKTTNMKFRDISAWYHIHIALDTTNGTAEDRMILTVNGTRVTSFASSTNSGSSDDLIIGTNTYKHRIGANQTSGDFFDGYLAEVVWIDGTASAATNFGEFDEDSPTIWKPKDVSGLSLGTNGYYLDFEDSANLGNDKNGGTDLTETNLAATDQTTDTPTLNYMTLNPVAAGVGDVNRIPTFSEGNTKFTAAGSDTFYQAISTFGVSTGSWYFEVKVASDQDLDKLRVGYWNIDKTVSSGEIQDVSAANSHVFYMNKDGGEMRLNTTATTADYGTFADDELMGVAIDMDAQTITILKANSVIVNAYDYSGGIAAGTVLTPAFMGYDDTAFQVNFGNPHEANSSDAADENGYGAFEFAPPSGYLAYNSANLGSDGG